MWARSAKVRKPINILRLRQNGQHFADDIFKCIFLNENVLISIKISLKFVLEGSFNNFPALVEIMGRQAIIWTNDGQVYWCIYASFRFSELTHCGLVILYHFIDLIQHCVRQWLAAWWYQVITWTNFYLSLRSCGIHPRAFYRKCWRHQSLK